MLEEIPAFSAMFGFIGCLLIVALSKILGRWLQRREDYYRWLRSGSGGGEQG